MKLSDLFAKMVTNETLANMDIPEFDSRTDDTVEDHNNSADNSNNTVNSTDDNMDFIRKQNEELNNRVKELEKANQKLMSGISLDEDEKAIEERIYDLCVPGHKKEVYNR